MNWVELNSGLVFYGIGLSLSTLQDTTKTQNNLSKRIWEDPQKGKAFLRLLGVMIAFFLIVGLIGYFRVSEGIFKDISFGLIVIGIGLIGLLKSGSEMFENHRLDKIQK